MGDYAPLNPCGMTPFTSKAGGTITGGKTVMASGDGTVTQGTAAGKATIVGIAAHDAASGAQVTVWPIHGPVHRVTCPGGVNAGAGVAAGDAGVVVTATIATEAAAGSLLGIALKTVAADAASIATFKGKG